MDFTVVFVDNIFLKCITITKNKDNCFSLILSNYLLLKHLDEDISAEDEDALSVDEDALSVDEEDIPSPVDESEEEIDEILDEKPAKKSKKSAIPVPVPVKRKMNAKKGLCLQNIQYCKHNSVKLFLTEDLFLQL